MDNYFYPDDGPMDAWHRVDVSHEDGSKSCHVVMTTPGYEGSGQAIKKVHALVIEQNKPRAYCLAANPLTWFVGDLPREEMTEEMKVFEDMKHVSLKARAEETWSQRFERLQDYARRLRGAR